MSITSKTFREWDPLRNQLKPIESLDEIPSYKDSLQQLINSSNTRALLPPPYSKSPNPIGTPTPLLKAVDNSTNPPSYETAIRVLGNLNNKDLQPLTIKLPLKPTHKLPDLSSEERSPPPTYFDALQWNLESFEKSMTSNLLKLVDEKS